MLAVTGLLVLGLAQGTKSGLALFYKQSALMEHRADLDAVYRVLRDLIAHARPGSEWEALEFVGAAHSAAFTTVISLPTVGPSATREDVELVVDPTHRLSLVWIPHLHAVRTGRMPTPAVVPLIDGVTQLDLSYWPAKDGGWTTIWRNSIPPRLVRMRILFADADRRWPVLVTAPMLDPL